MKKIMFILCMLCTSSYAQVSPLEVTQECYNQMSIGICKVPVDRRTLAPGQTMILSGVGRVAMSALADYTDLYNPIVPTDPAMCDLALHYMTTQPGGDHDKIARAYWTPIPKADSVSVTSQVKEALLNAMKRADAGASLFLVLATIGTLVYNRRKSIR